MSSCHQGLWPFGEPHLLHGTLVQTHDGRKEFQCFWLLPLERVPADDRAESTTIADRAHFGEDLLISGSGSARENDDAAPSKCALDNVAYTLFQRRYGNLVLLVDLLRLRSFHLCGWQLDLDDMCSELGCNLGSVGDHVNGGLTLFTQAAAAGIRPDDHGQANCPGFTGEFAQLLIHPGTLS